MQFFQIMCLSILDLIFVLNNKGDIKKQAYCNNTEHLETAVVFTITIVPFLIYQKHVLRFSSLSG